VSKSGLAVCPVIYYPSEIKTESLGSGDRSIVAVHCYFAGDHDGNKAEYYFNDPLPDGWRLLRSFVRGDSRYLYISTEYGDYALVRYWYQIGPHRTSNRSTFIAYRFLEALRLNQKTELHWYWAASAPETREATAQELSAMTIR